MNISEEVAKYESYPFLYKAVCFAVKRHGNQLRKGTDRLFITHPLETLSILVSIQADTELQLAGVLHDTVEDTCTTSEEIAGLFGQRVADLVASHTEDKTQSWEDRKLAAVEALKRAPLPAKTLVLADKVANLRDMYADHQACGEGLWKRFNAPKEKQHWYYEQMYLALSELQNHDQTAALYAEMHTLCQALFQGTI